MSKYIKLDEVIKIATEMGALEVLIRVMELPTIDIPTWIPCSERLPDKNGWYLLAQAFEWGIEYEGGTWEDGAWWINDNSHVTVAWKPIEPYKEKTDE